MKNIAIIGSNTGILLAWLLCDDFKVTLFEKEERLGGHLNTLKIPQTNGKRGSNGSDKDFAIVEGGAEFLNSSYVNVFKLIEHLGIKTNKYLMSMEYIDDDERISLTPNLLLNFDNLKKSGNCCKEIIKDFSDKFPILLAMQHLILKYITEKKNLEKNTITLDEYMNLQSFMDDKSKNFIRRICSSSWGILPEKAGDSLAYYMLNYLASYPIFKEVIGGLSEIIRKLEKRINNKVEIFKSFNVLSVNKIDDKYSVSSENKTFSGFDDVIFCTNAKISNQIMKTDINDYLSKVSYYKTLVSFQKNKDENLNKDVVVHIVNKKDYAETTILKYFNSDISKKWCLDDILPENSLEARRYEHPYMDINYFNAQEAIKNFNQKMTGVFYGSIIAGYDDSYESGVCASIDIAKIIFSKYNLKRTQKLNIFNNSCC